MARKSKKLKTPRAVTDLNEKTLDTHIVEPMPSGIPDGAHPMVRLGTFIQGPFPFKPADVAAGLNFVQGGAFFCDSTMFMSQTAPEIWSALMRDRRVVLARAIVEELEPWLRDPRGANMAVHPHIVAAVRGSRSSWVRLEEPPNSEVLRTAGDYYLNLLATRKHSLDIARQRLEEELGRPATAQEVSNECQKAFTSRGQLLGRQGLDVKVEKHRYNDERLVLAAIFHAIRTGEEVTLLTSDEAVFDQFWKAILLIHGHYFSMSFADLYAAQPSHYSAKQEKYGEDGVFVKDEALIIQKPSPLSYDLLPTPNIEVQIHCMLLQSAWTRITYNAELSMRRLLRIKGQTGGLNTDRLNGRNCHWYLTINGIKHHGDNIAIGNDVTVPNRLIHVCPIDLELSLASYLNPIPIKYVTPGEANGSQHCN